jgi:hypothetical protein
LAGEYISGRPVRGNPGRAGAVVREKENLKAKTSIAISVENAHNPATAFAAHAGRDCEENLKVIS